MTLFNRHNYQPWNLEGFLSLSTSAVNSEIKMGVPYA